jgi:S-adenosylmethionine:tRNA ribosyltransferase-isomerase
MEKVIIASNNKAKIKEIIAILSAGKNCSDKDYAFSSLADAGIDIGIPETGNTFEENALIKARTIYNITGSSVIADDSGLEVEYLNGEPGVYSARYAGDGATDKANNDKLLTKMADVPFEQRKAQFVCAIAYIDKSGVEHTVRAEFKGYIALEEVENPPGGFGYDSLFYLPEYKMTSAEIPSETKNELSHRGKALRMIAEKLFCVNEDTQNNGMHTSDYMYDLPEELIAQTPISNREMSRLLVVNRENKSIEHKTFRDMIDYLNEGDCLVLNNTRVIPARLLGEKEGSGGKIEFLLLEKVPDHIDEWEVILRPGKKARRGAKFVFGNGLLKAEVIDIIADGKRIVKFFYEGLFENILDKIGVIPLPPYINEKLEDDERYQTVYSKYKGAAAAPTAGLHFTEKLLEEIENKGINIAYATLHVGLGTFRPVEADSILEHKMHSEYFEISQETCDIINNTKARGGKVVCVGTTSCRMVESIAKKKIDGQGWIATPFKGRTDIFIYPGYEFKIMDSLITNFHLPGSTLIMLVSAFAGREFILSVYEEAIKERYRFFSFGDAMLIL